MSDSVHYPRTRTVAPRAKLLDSLHLRLFTVDSLTIPATQWNSRNVQSPFWRFYRNEDEGAYIDLESEERFWFRANQVYFVPSGVRFSCGNNTTFRHFYIHFDLIGLSRFTLRALFAGPVVLPGDVSFSAQVADFAQEVAIGETLDIAARCRAKGLIYEGLARYLRSLPIEANQRIQQETVQQATLAPALAYIEENLNDPITVSHLARLCCLSPDYFARRFKAVLGQTPNDYLREQRAIQAAQRLLFSNDSLETIATSCGFGSRHYLTRVFTEVMGVPPATYRKQGAGSGI